MYYVIERGTTYAALAHTKTCPALCIMKDLGGCLRSYWIKSHNPKSLYVMTKLDDSELVLCKLLGIDVMLVDINDVDDDIVSELCYT